MHLSSHTLQTLLRLFCGLSAVCLSYLRRDLRHSSCSSCSLLLPEDGNIKLVLRIFIHVLQVLCDAILRSQILLCEIYCLFVAKNSGRVRAQEFLLYTHVVVGNGKDSCAVLGVFVSCRKFLLFLLHCMRIQPLSKLHFLKKDHCRHGVIQCELMLIQLTENGTYVEVCVSLDLRSLEACFDCQCLLQEVQCSPHLSNPTVVAGHVVKGHSHAQLVGLAKFFGLFK